MGSQRLAPKRVWPMASTAISAMIRSGTESAPDPEACDSPGGKPGASATKPMPIQIDLVPVHAGQVAGVRGGPDFQHAHRRRWRRRWPAATSRNRECLGRSFIVSLTGCGAAPWPATAGCDLGCAEPAMRFPPWWFAATVYAVLLVVIGLDDIAHDRARQASPRARRSWTSTATTISGLRRGAIAHEPGIVLHSASFPSLRLRSRSSINCAVPDLAGEFDILEAASWSRAAFVHHAAHSLRDLFDRVLGNRKMRRLRLGYSSSGAAGRSRRRWRPPAIMRASCSGVTITAPWPMATEIVSPGYHLWW